MEQQEFLKQLEHELAEIGADFQIDSHAEQFGLWIGRTIFGEDPQTVIEDRILYVGSGATQPALCVIRVDDETAGAELVLCEFSFDRSSELNCGALLRSWEEALTQPLLLRSAGQDFRSERQDDPAMPLAYTFATTGIGGSCTIGKVLDSRQLAILYTRNSDPNAVTEPESLDLPVAAEGGEITYEMSGGDAAEDISVHIRPIPLEIIHRWVKQHRNGLFAENLRYRLADKTDKSARDLDAAIQATVASTPERMLIQNNGLTITCRRVGKEAAGVLRLFEPQIVNGCQTSWAIFEAVERSIRCGSPPPTGYALAKIIVTADPGVASQITRSSNRQNAISPKDEAARDPRQIGISSALSSFATNLRVHWDHRRGALANIEAKAEVQEYRVMNHPKLYRILRNELGGQVMLAMAGAVLEAKNKQSELFNVDSPLPRWAFAYNLPTLARFDGLKAEPYLESGGTGDLNRYVADVTFGFAVYQHAVGAFREGHAALQAQLAKRASIDNLDPAVFTASKATRDFVRYWTFDVVRLVHRIAEAWVRDRGKDREVIRGALVGDLRRPKFMDALFLPKGSSPQWFRLDLDPTRANVLDPGSQPRDLLLAKWFVELEQIGAEVILDAKARDPVSTRSLVLSRRATHEALMAAVETVIAGSTFERRFSLEA